MATKPEAPQSFLDKLKHNSVFILLMGASAVWLAANHFNKSGYEYPNTPLGRFAKDHDYKLGREYRVKYNDTPISITEKAGVADGKVLDYSYDWGDTVPDDAAHGGYLAENDNVILPLESKIGRPVLTDSRVDNPSFVEDGSTIASTTYKSNIVTLPNGHRVKLIGYDPETKLPVDSTP